MKLARTLTLIDRFGCPHEIPVFVRRPHRIVKAA